MQKQIELVRNLGRPEGIDPLKPLLDHWSSRIVSHAAEAIRALGAEPPQVPNRSPVRFKLTALGQPLANQEIDATIGCRTWTGHLNATTNAEGDLSLARDVFLRPARTPKTITFLVDEHSMAEKRSGASVTAPAWWFYTIPLPSTLDDTTVVNVPLGKLVLTIAHPNGGPANDECWTQIELRQVSSDTSELYTLRQFTFPTANRIEFPVISQGVYDMALTTVGGATRHDRLRIGPGTTLRHVQLVKGSTLAWPTFCLSSNGDGACPPFELWSGGKKLSEHTLSMPGGYYPPIENLPKGRYQIKVRSSERIAADWKRTHPDSEGPGAGDDQQWDATTTGFVVGDSSPAMMELPRIRLNPPRGKTK